MLCALPCQRQVLFVSKSKNAMSTLIKTSKTFYCSHEYKNINIKESILLKYTISPLSLAGLSFLSSLLLDLVLLSIDGIVIVSRLVTLAQGEIGDLFTVHLTISGVRLGPHPYNVSRV